MVDFASDNEINFDSEVKTIESENSENIIYVDEDFQGDLKAAISSADDGDTVILENYKNTTHRELISTKILSLRGKKVR